MCPLSSGHRAFVDSTAWALRWDREAVVFYKTNKKARLQNSSYYFRPGIAVPMVTSRRLSASLMDSAVFDQGVVGVFPHDQEAREAILLYLNSSKATELRNEIVNGSANNSANYLKRLPSHASGQRIIRRQSGSYRWPLLKISCKLIHAIVSCSPFLPNKIGCKVGGLVL